MRLGYSIWYSPYLWPSRLSRDCVVEVTRAKNIQAVRGRPSFLPSGNSEGRLLYLVVASLWQGVHVIRHCYHPCRSLSACLSSRYLYSWYVESLAGCTGACGKGTECIRQLVSLRLTRYQRQLQSTGVVVASFLRLHCFTDLLLR